MGKLNRHDLVCLQVIDICERSLMKGMLDPRDGWASDVVGLPEKFKEQPSVKSSYGNMDYSRMSRRESIITDEFFKYALCYIQI